MFGISNFAVGGILICARTVQWLPEALRLTPRPRTSPILRGLVQPNVYHGDKGHGITSYSMGRSGSGQPVTFSYERLKPGQFRLLKIKPGSGESISCHVEPHWIDPGRRPPYKCLSYQWGPSDFPQSMIRLNGCDFKVRRNLSGVSGSAKFEGRLCGREPMDRCNMHRPG